MAYPLASSDFSSTNRESQGGNNLRILVGGSSGLIGSQLCRYLGRIGHEVRKLVRHPPGPTGDEIQWDPSSGRLNADDLTEFDAFINLSGENIAGGRWTESVRRRIRDSRVDSTRLLADALIRLQARPRILIVASAIGYYGDRGDEVLTEDSRIGSGFLPDVCQEWEAAADGAKAAGVRVINVRIGVVLSSAGGALAKMLGPFRMGVGGVVGSGRQWVSWITLSDLARVFGFLLSSNLVGPVNAVSPEPVTNREFTKTLGTVLHRPTVMPISATMLRLTLGRMADETLLASTRVMPARLAAAGFVFEHPRLEEALRHELRGNVD